MGNIEIADREASAEEIQKYALEIIKNPANSWVFMAVKDNGDNTTCRGVVHGSFNIHMVTAIEKGINRIRAEFAKGLLSQLIKDFDSINKEGEKDGKA